MYRISKTFHFSASHQLDGLPEGHQCGRLHGHNYIVRVELAAPSLDERGFVTDYAELSDVKTWLDDCLDHRHLNDVFPDMNTTAENMARLMFERFAPAHPNIASVSISETPKTWATYSPGS